METNYDRSDNSYIYWATEVTARYANLKSKVFAGLPHPDCMTSSQSLLWRIRVSYIKELSVLAIYNYPFERILFGAADSEDFYNRLISEGYLEADEYKTTEAYTAEADEAGNNFPEGITPPPRPFSDEFLAIFEDTPIMIPDYEGDEED